MKGTHPMSNPQMGTVIPTPILKRLSGETRRLSKINICVPNINTLAFNVEKLIVSHRFQRSVAQCQYVVERTNKRIHFANYRRPFVPNLSRLPHVSIIEVPVPDRAFNRGLYDRATRNLNWGHFAPRRSS